MRSRLIPFVLLLGSVTGASAQMRPHARWQQIETDHFRVVFEAGLDSIAQHAARRAEAHYARLGAELSRPPRGKIDVIIGDNLDLTNGAATPLPSNRIFLWVRPPVDDLGLAYHNDWMDLVIAHELTHIFQLDRAGKVGRALRTVFGRVPWGWPFFPALGAPRWMFEGPATYRESVHTGTGRVYGSYHKMVVRTAILADEFDQIDVISGETPTWPAGQRAYIYGSLFMEYIADKLGPEAHRALIDETAGSILPPPWVLDRIARKAVGKSYSQLYREWRNDLLHRYQAEAEQIRAAGVTSGEPLSDGERIAWYPRVSPDGTRLAFVQEDGRSTSHTVIRDLSSGATSRTRRNSLAPVAWANNTTIVTTQPDLVDPYTIYSDVYYQIDGNQQRRTRGARYDAVDAERSGRRLIVIANAGGQTSLVQHDTYTGTDRVIVEARPDVQWVSARWSPDGQRIAAQRWLLGGRHDIVVMDTLGNPVSERPHPWVFEERATDAAPTWTPDGRFVLFTSDRSGVNNIYAFDPLNPNGLVFQVTNVLTGVFFPEVSPDGQWIYYSAYHADGFRIERLRYDMNTWRPVAYQRAGDTIMVAVPEQTGSPRPVRDYSALRSALPKFWLPVIQHDSVQGTFIGAFSAGFDDVERHQWAGELAVNFANGRMLGGFDYTYAGLGNPLLTVQASREYDLLAEVSVRREDNVALLATLLRPRWRSNLALSLGVEGVVVKRDTMLGILDGEDRLLGVIGRVSFGNFRLPAYAISPEDGVRASLLARRRFDVDPVFNDDTYSELQGLGAAYKSVEAFGFAHHVLAARVSGLYRTGLGIGPTDVGGLGDLLPVRGFSDGDRIGFRAWTASLEYRMPVAMIGRGAHLFPVFIDRIAASAFIDAGNASCTATQREIYEICPGNPERGDGMLLSAGGEVLSNIAFLSFMPTWMRGGLAVPLSGPRSEPRAYLTFGVAF